MKKVSRIIIVMSLLFSVNHTSAQWVKIWKGSVDALSIVGSNIYVGTQGGGVSLSSDDGKTWTPINTGITDYANLFVNCIAASPNKIFVATSHGVFVTANKGGTWTSMTALTDLVVTPFPFETFGVSGSTILASAIGDIYISANEGVTWNKVTGIPKQDITAFCYINNSIFIGTDGGVYLSTNNGTSWGAVNSGLTCPFVNNLVASNGKLYAGTQKGAFTSSDNGATWTEIKNGLTTQYLTGLTVAGGNVFAGSNGGGVFMTKNNGATWSAVNMNMTELYVTDCYATQTTLYVGTLQGLWKRPLSEFTTGVDGTVSQRVPEYRLDQNFPNPFNPSTTISFSLPSKAFASLKVFDVIGREVATLASEEMNAGTHQLQWNAAAMPSGVYFYRLRAGTFSETKKLLLMQ